MKQNNLIFKIISSLMILITLLSVANATTISNSLSTFSNNIDMGTKELYNATNINATNFYSNGVLLKPDTNNFPLSIQVTGTTSKTLNLERNGTTNLTAGFTDIDTDTTYSNGTGLNLTGTTFYLDLNYADGIYVKRNTWTSIDNYPTGCSAGQYISTIGDTLTCSTPSGNPTYNVTSVQVTGTTTKTITLEQLGLTNITATFTDIDTDTDTNTNDNVTAIQFTGTGTKTLTLQQSGGNTNLTATFTDIDTDTDTNSNVTSIQVTGTTTKTLNLQQPSLTNLTASWTDIDTDTTYSNTTGLTLSGTVFGLDTIYAVGQYMTRSNWTSIDNYPTACSSGQFVSGVGDTLTCATPSDVKNVTSIQVTGTTTKTLNLEQGGIANRTATWTDIDTDTDTVYNTTSIQVTGAGTKTLNLEQMGTSAITNKTAQWTDLDTVYNTTNIQFTGTATKTFTLEQTGSSAITNKTATFTDLTNSSADMIFAVNNTAGLYTFQGLNISTSRVNMNTQNLTFTQGTGVILNNSQSHTNLYLNSSGCVVMQGATGSISIC